MQNLKKGRLTWLAVILCAFLATYLFTVQHIDTVYAAEDERLWVDEDWNILTLVPEGWSWIEDYASDIPVIFLPDAEKGGKKQDFVYLTYLGKQTGEDIDKLKDEYVKGLKGDLDNFKLNSTEKVSTGEGLTAYDLSYTFTINKTDALGYDRLTATEEDIYWAISFSAGKTDFKRLKNGAISIIDSFIFDASEWLEHKQEKD